MLLVALLALFCLVLGVGLTYAILGEPYRPVFRRHQVRLPSRWPGLSIVHISDLHVRGGDQRLFRAQRAALQGLAPDLLCVTGDVCEKVEDIYMVVELLRTVRPRLGTYVVLGNHEHNAGLPLHLRELHRRGWRKAVGRLLHLAAPRLRSEGEHEGHAMVDALRAAGITVLHNEGRRVVADGHSLWIAGCDSAWAGHADMRAAMDGKVVDEACLALIHEPDLAFEAGELGADLILAGHTHGGQVRFPLVGALYTLRMDPRILIAAGFQHIEEAVLHITTGLGHTIPLRFRCPPEVVWLECAPPGLTPELARAA
ncbi:MAG: metallophosphoesterase [Chloroflexi bacterium]|nr:metallophosphoesterase [Chloroflexota bacterium]